MVGNLGSREICRWLLTSAKYDAEMVLQAAGSVNSKEQAALQGTVISACWDAIGLELAAWPGVGEVDRHLKFFFQF